MEHLPKVKQEPDMLPSDYEWILCDMSSDDMSTQVYKFLKRHYPDTDLLMESYSREFLQWALCPPGFHQSWHIGVRAIVSKKLVGFVGGVPSRIRVNGVVVEMAIIKLLCVHKLLRSKRLGYVLTKEMTRRVQLKNVLHGAYTSDDETRATNLPTPITTCQYWVRYLNPKKLNSLGISAFSKNVTVSRAIRLYSLPDATVTPGFREMGHQHVTDVTKLLKNYLSKFTVAPEFSVNDVAYWFLPREGVLYSYVVENPETLEVTDFCSFYTNQVTVGNPTPTTLENAYGFYNVAVSTPLANLMKDAMIMSKLNHCDAFYVTDVMDNEAFFEDLKFDIADQALNYHFQNYHIDSQLLPSEVGMIL